MNTFTGCRTLFYKRALLLLAASGVAFAATAQHQHQEMANPSAISAQRLRELLAGPAGAPGSATSVFASTDSSRATSPRYEQPADGPATDASASGQYQPLPQAPAEEGGAEKTNRNLARLDLLTPLGVNLGFNLFANKGILLPIMVSYERAVAKRWSVNAESIINGGYPDQRRHGGSLSVRYYVRPARKTTGPLAGWYLAPVAGYLALRVTDEPPLLVVRAKRLKFGALIGWQHALGRAASRVMLDVAAGATYWSVLGNDQVYQPGNVNGTGFGVLRAGIRPEARTGIGYRF